MIRAIVAIDDKNGLAKGTLIPWDIPADKHYFRAKTEGATVVMGYTTAEQFAAPLPNRRNIVVSSNHDSAPNGFELIYNLPVFLDAADEDVWIIGGAKIYEVALTYCRELYITRIKGDYNCDKFFPAFAEDFALVSESAPQSDNGYDFRYNVYTRKPAVKLPVK